MRKPPPTTLLTISSALLVVAPKCPVCFLAYFGICGVATASVSIYYAWLPMVTAIWLAVTLAVLAWRTDRRRKYGPLALAVGASLSAFAGKFIVEKQVMLYAGIAALIVAAVWSWWSRISPEPACCSQCEQHPRLTEPETQAGS